MTLNDVLNFGGIGERQKVQSLQFELQFDDPINIQFTSVCIFTVILSYFY